ncbi:hypothetical protein [Christiangramia salexigens]|uniref:STAS/SEC14 domain-containing protein n=1 Tax=Christiangramia salexigens TaxID=1913577 RepID=A0A1L3J3C0_9FLAO|nr:hypothetical protein [Christiangramia salexigens]APG59625.1 hypothetical protein LPB144_04015 [Christiangramia salexigens]
MPAKEVQLTFGKISIHDNFLVAKFNEGVLFNLENNRQLLNLANETFNGGNFGYISNRENSYAVDPMVYRESASITNLKAIAVVCNNDLTKRNAVEVERKFYKNDSSFKVFDNLEEAITWVKQMI